MKFMSMFEAITYVSVKDCFIDETNNLLTFIVSEGKLGKALGKKASNIKNIENRLKRRIKVVEYNADVKSFIKSLLFPLAVNDILEIEQGVFQIEPQDSKTRGMIIGRNAVNLRNLEKIARRFFEINEIKVV